MKRPSSIVSAILVLVTLCAVIDRFYLTEHDQDIHPGPLTSVIGRQTYLNSARASGMLTFQDSVREANSVDTEVQPTAKVVILAYNRGGSTLTGQMFNFNPAAFYLFEPLAGVASEREDYYYKNGSIKSPTGSNDALVVNTLRKIVSCHLTQTDTRVFNHFFMQAGWTRDLMFSAKSFRSCVQRVSRDRVIGQLGCIRRLADKCERRGIVAAKVIRLSMSHAEQLLETDRSVKLLHAVRDPRGIVSSRTRLEPKRKTRPTREERQQDIKFQCDMMLTDCVIRRRLEQKFPGRILLLRYEDLVASPERVLRDVYSGLLRLAVPDGVTDAIKLQIHASTYDSPVGTRRVNGSATAASWRGTIDKDLHEYSKMYCRSLLSELSYDP